MLKSIKSFPILCRNCRDSDIVNSKEVREKTRKTNLMKFGAENNSKTVEWHNKVRNPLLEKYGVEHQSQIEEVKRKIHDTNIRRYGGIGFASSDLKSKQEDTMLSMYGVRHNMLSDELKKKCLDSIASANGGIGNSSKKTFEKHKKTMLERYGVEHSMQSNYILRNAKKKYKYDNLQFDSKSEIRLYKYLLKNKIDFIYHPDVKITYKLNGKIHRYFPDFMINGRLIEVKEKHLLDESLHLKPFYNSDSWDKCFAKQKCMEDNNVIMIVANGRKFDDKFDKLLKLLSETQFSYHAF